MSGIVLLVLRILLAALLYGFLIWAFLTIWRDLRAQGQLISAPSIPLLSMQVLNDGAGENHQLEFTSPEIIIGRSANNDICISNETVSARHARLRYHHNQWWIEDMRSTNGTFLNDERVSTPTVVVSGDELRCGQVSMLISIEEKAR